MTYVSTTKATPTPLPMLAWWVVTPHHVAPNLKLLFLKRFNGDNIISVKFKKIPPQNITLWAKFWGISITFAKIWYMLGFSIHIYKRESFNSWRWFSANSSQTWRARGMKFGHNLHQYMWSDMGGLNLGYHPQGRPQAKKGVGKCSPEALTPRVLMLLQ